MALDKLYPLIPSADLGKYARVFYQEMVAALSNQHSSLPTILNPIHRPKPQSGFGVAISVGGTNGYASAFKIAKKGIIKFLNRKSFPIPPQITMEELFHLITKNILAVTTKKRKTFPIGLGLAYPLRPVLNHNFLDGELLYMSKGRNIEGLVGKKVGQEYHKFLVKEYGIDTTVSVANDAVCLLLGGDGVEVAGIVGTGLNFAYWEKRENIAPIKLRQLPGFSQKEMAINLEAKNFDKILGTPLRQVVDRKSSDPGYSLAEKEAAGAYLYQIFNAGKDKIIGKNFPSLSSTDELNEILGVGLKNTSVRKTRLFAERIFHRSSQIVAIELGGILMKIGKTKGIVPIVMEGGIFWKAKNYPRLVNFYVNQILPEVIPSFTRLFGSSRRGIAILASSGP